MGETSSQSSLDAELNPKHGCKLWPAALGGFQLSGPRLFPENIQHLMKQLRAKFSLGKTQALAGCWKHLSGWMEGGMDAWIKDGQTDGWTCGQMGRWMDRWMDGLSTGVRAWATVASVMMTQTPGEK